jgi:GMP synthase-like glutamine amidotransferase
MEPTVVKICCLTHVPFEGPANIAAWAQQRGHALGTLPLYDSPDLSAARDADWLAIMGGPMNIYEEDEHPWLSAEKDLLRRAIDDGKTLVGVCLGAQLLADVLGGSVAPNPHPEIGWFPVRRTASDEKCPLLTGVPETFEAFHWHGDRLETPPGAVHLAGSDACDNQAFAWEHRVLGLQCHLDYTAAGIEEMLTHCGDELRPGPFVQTPDQIRPIADQVAATQKLLFAILDNLAAVRADRKPTRP